MARKKMIRVSEEEYELVERAQKTLLKRGWKSLEIPEEDLESFDLRGVHFGTVVGIACFMLLRNMGAEE